MSANMESELISSQNFNQLKSRDAGAKWSRVIGGYSILSSPGNTAVGLPKVEVLKCWDPCLERIHRIV